MRVLLSTIGSRGEVQPVVALASELRALGQSKEAEQHSTVSVALEQEMITKHCGNRLLVDADEQRVVSLGAILFLVYLTRLARHLFQAIGMAECPFHFGR